MKNKPKKKTKILIAVCCILLVVSLGLVTYNGIYNTYNRWIFYMDEYELRNFRPNKESFEIVAIALLELYDEEYNKNNDVKYFYSDSDPSFLSLCWNLTCISNSDADDYMINPAISEEECKAYLIIYNDVFQNAGIKNPPRFYVYDDRVIFTGYTDYAIIYMENGKKPDFIFFENESYNSIFVERIAPKWYQAVGRVITE